MEFCILFLIYTVSTASATNSDPFLSLSLPGSGRSPASLDPTSTDGNCGSNSATNATCLNSTFGNCCSPKGFCGSTADYCGPGCQASFGTCPTSSTQIVSMSGSCGATSTTNLTCLGSTFGDCCSGQGFCGGNASYCGTGCQSGFGNCSAAATSSSPSQSTSSSSSTATGSVSLDGNCGFNSVTLSTCIGSRYGACCSENGHCGGTSVYCGTGCQLEFGNCTASELSPSSTPSSHPLPATTTSLSVGAKIGIGIGAAVVLVASVGLIVWYVLRRKNDRKRRIQESAGMKYESEATSTSSAHEMGTDHIPAELPVSHVPTGGTKGRHEQDKQKKARIDDRAAAGYEGAYRGN